MRKARIIGRTKKQGKKGNRTLVALFAGRIFFFIFLNGNSFPLKQLGSLLRRKEIMENTTMMLLILCKMKTKMHES